MFLQKHYKELKERKAVAEGNFIQEWCYLQQLPTITLQWAVGEITPLIRAHPSQSYFISRQLPSAGEKKKSTEGSNNKR